MRGSACADRAGRHARGDSGRRNVERAGASARSGLLSRRPVRLVYGDRAWTLQPARFGARVAISDGVLRARREGRLGGSRSFRRSTPRRCGGSSASWTARLGRGDRCGAQRVLRGFVRSSRKERTGVQVLRSLTAQRIVRALQSPQIRRIRVAVKTLQPARTVAHFGPVIVIRRGANQLRYYQGARLVRLFGVATGQAIYPTPTGTFSIVDMQKNPWWLPPDSARGQGRKADPAWPGNPLGTRWMGLSTPGVGMRGTPDDTSIGYSASHGCIRMHIPDAEWLFQHVEIGTPSRNHRHLERRAVGTAELRHGNRNTGVDALKRCFPWVGVNTAPPKRLYERSRKFAIRKQIDVWTKAPGPGSQRRANLSCLCYGFLVTPAMMMPGQGLRVVHRS